MSVIYLDNDQINRVVKIAKSRRPDLFTGGRNIIGRSYKDLFDISNLYRSICKELGYR
jgi:hypothetical protein